MFSPKQAIHIGFVGQIKVGKSTFIKKALHKEEIVQPTRIVQINQGLYECDDASKVKVYCWDTEGDLEQFQKVKSALGHLRNASAIIMMYDLTDFHSFQRLKQWERQLKRKAIDSRLVYLVGNKADLVETQPRKRRVSRQMAQQFLQTLRFPERYALEVSSLNGHSVSSLFSRIIDDIEKNRLELAVQAKRFSLSIAIQSDERKRFNEECSECSKCTIF